MIALQNAAVLPDMEELYNQYYRRIYNYIYGRILHRENAEDLTAEVFIAVYQNLSQMDEGRGSLATWMFAIARNAVRDFSRRAAFRREVSGEVPDVTAPEDNMGKDDSLRNPDSRWTEGILRRLTDEERDLLEMRYTLDLSNAEVGKLIGASAGTVSQRYHRLLEKCRKLAEEMES